MIPVISIVAMAAIVMFLIVYISKGATPEQKAQQDQTVLDEPKPDWLSRTFGGQNGPIVGCGFLVALFIAGFLFFMVQWERRSNRIEAEQRVAQAEAAKKQAEENEENKRKGFHCLSPWDGSEPDVVEAVKRTLRDPGSFEHVKTTITPVNAKGFHYLIMIYRARNGFGGMNIGRVIAHVTPGCSVRIVSMEE